MGSGVGPAEVALPSRICVSIGHGNPEMLLKLARAEAERGESFFEFCLEFLENPHDGPEIVRQFLRDWPGAWVLVTCRREERNFNASIEEQLALLGAAVDAGARGIDLEIETARQRCSWMDEMGRRSARIVSYHNFTGCPPLEPILKELQSIPADIIKVAVRAEDKETVQRLMQAAQRCRQPNLMLAMGPEGLMSRIIGPILGQSFTYAAPAGHDGTASGQPDARTLREIFGIG